MEGAHVQFKTGTAGALIAWNPSSLGGVDSANETASCESSTQTMSMAPKPIGVGSNPKIEPNLTVH